MINTSLNAYLQNGAVQNNTTTDKNDKTAKSQSENANNKNSIDIVISPNTKAMLKIETLNEKLEEIFGRKKTLTTNEKEKEDSLKDAIKKLDKNGKLPYSETDKSRIKALGEEIKSILNRDYYNYHDDSEVLNLTKEINSIDQRYSSNSLSEEDNEKKEKLISQLRSLQGYNEPSVSELIQAEKIYNKIDMVKYEYQLSQLDPSSSTYEEDTQLLNKKFSEAEDNIKQLDTTESRSKQEVTRESSKHLIQQSLQRMATIQDSFAVGGSFFEQRAQQFSLSSTQSINNSEGYFQQAGDNKWLNFLQETREDMMTGLRDGYELNEDEELQSLVNNVRALHR